MEQQVNEITERLKQKVSSWSLFANGLRYSWLVDYATYTAGGQFELSDEEWDNRNFVSNFKGNSELTTEFDHQNALSKAIEMVSTKIKEIFDDEAQQITLVCIPASTLENTERRFKEFSQKVCQETGMENAYDHFFFKEDDTGFTMDMEWFKDRQVLVFDDIIASGHSIMTFADNLQQSGINVIGALALAKKREDNYDQLS